MKILLDNGADINFGLDMMSIRDRPNSIAIGDDSEFHTALFWAVRARNLGSVRFLLSNGAAIAGSTMHKETPLHEASYLGVLAILELLLNYCPDQTHLDLKGVRFKNSEKLRISRNSGHN